MNVKQKVQLYDRLYNHADKLIKKHNPCKMKNGKCLRGKPCCDNCPHLTENGCAIDCLMCKLFLCWRVTERNESLTKIFDRIWRKAYTHNLLHLRYSKKETIKFLQEGKEVVCLKKQMGVVYHTM
jgi:hypothetical protein